MQHLAFFVTEEDAMIAGGYVCGKYNSKTTSRVKHLGAFGLVLSLRARGCVACRWQRAA